MKTGSGHQWCPDDLGEQGHPAGHLGAEPEARQLASGEPLASLRQAITQTWKHKADGEKKEQTDVTCPARSLSRWGSRVGIFRPHERIRDLCDYCRLHSLELVRLVPYQAHDKRLTSEVSSRQRKKPGQNKICVFLRTPGGRNREQPAVMQALPLLPT